MPRKPATPKSDNARRAIRTGFQAISVQAFIQLYNAFASNDITTDQAAILTVVCTPLVSYLQNYLETRGSVPTMLKGAPAPAPTDDMTRRELDALAAAIGDQHKRLERLEGAGATMRQRVPEEVPFRG